MAEDGGVVPQLRKGKAEGDAHQVQGEALAGERVRSGKGKRSQKHKNKHKTRNVSKSSNKTHINEEMALEIRKII